MRSRIVGCVFVAALAIAGGVAYAVQLNGLGSTYWAMTQDFTTTSACVASQEYTTCTSKGCSTICALFPAGEGPDHHRKVVIIDSPGPLQGCFVGLAGLDISARLQIDDGSADGAGSCFKIATIGGVKTKHLSWVSMLENGSSGFRPGLCSSPLLIANERRIYWPCATAGDCTDIDTGAGTVSAGTACNTGTDITRDQRENAGVILTIEASAGTVNATIEKEWIQL